MDDLTAAVTHTRWHEGEVAIQRHAGVADLMAPVAEQVIRDYLIEQHRAFFPKLPFVVTGVVDPEGDVWATVLVGAPGFLGSPNPRVLRVKASLETADPARAGLEDGEAIGLLGIELQTRRRNRLNGIIRRTDPHTLDVEVVQSYGNCPQYIHQRDFRFVRDPAVAFDGDANALEKLDARATEMISTAETFFVASYVDRPGVGRQVDVSHKGGRAGFVRIGDDGMLTIPDFAGNLYFNTLGNVLVNHRVGLIFVDFANGDVLQLTGDGRVILSGPEVDAFQGAERLLRVQPRRIVFRPGALPLRWESRPQGISANVLLTGTWPEAAARQRAVDIGANWRPFAITKVVDESSVIRSLYLQPADGAGLIPHLAGQHLPIRVTLPGADSPTSRTYSLSSAASDQIYRLSVKRDGVVSRHLHALSVGDVIEARGPAGTFTIDAHNPRPAVFLAAGVGITPMVAMLRHLVYEGRRKRQVRPTWMIFAAHSKSERAFERELLALAAAAQGHVTVTRVLGDSSTAAAGDYEIAGRISVGLLREAGRLDQFEFYICGPATFAQDLYDGLRAVGVPDRQIFAEAFGPASLKRRRGLGGTAGSKFEPAAGPVEVVFSKSGLNAQWTPAAGTLLEFAETLGLDPPSSCRGGSCGTCRTRVLAGAVAYNPEPGTEVSDHEALICCARPAIGEGQIVLDL